jgi:tRNA pseudouridine38-40 synthase
MPRYKLTIEYDGTDFCGWQKQEPFAPMEQEGAGAAPGQKVELCGVHAGTDVHAAAEDIGVREGETRSRVALRTVQHVVERAVREVVREPVVLMGASRTDSGVHARGQVAAFTCSGDASVEGADVPSELRGVGWPISRGADRLLRAINGRLPEDVQVVAAEVTTPDFNPIGDAKSKAYSYTLCVSPPPPTGLSLRPMWNRKYVQQIWGRLDVAAMNEAAKRIVGEHDFAAFAAAGHGRLSTVRTVFSCEVTDVTSGGDARLGHGDADDARVLRIDISGSGFLYNMVRIISGTLVEVGRGKMTAVDVAAAIESKDRRNAGPTLPGTGLCLEWIRY